VLRKRPRPGSTPQQEGRRFESFWSKFFGVEPTRGSGNQWTAPLDVGDVQFLFSLKETSAESFRVSKQLMREVEQAIHGPGGKGGDIVPALAVVIENEEVFVTLRGEDFLRLISSPNARYVTPTRAEQKRARAQIPEILRDDHE
jgi:hypothetical protein